MKNLKRLRLFLNNPLELADNLAADGPTIQRLYIGPKPFVFVFNAHAAREILVSKAAFFGKNPYVLDRITPVTGEHGLVQLEGALSREYRRKSRPIFTTQNLNRVEILIRDICGNYLDTFSGEALNISHAMTDLILSTAFRIFLGVNLSDFSKHIGEIFLRLNQVCGHRMTQLIALPLWIPTPRHLEILRLRKLIRHFISGQLLATQSEEENVSKAFANDNFLLDQCMTFLFAGHETTASSLAFSFLLLANFPHYQDRIADGDQDFTKALYKESLRLYPPAYMVVKLALEDIEVSGVRIKKGDQIIIGIKQMHRFEKYFPAPDNFYPERFLKEPNNDAFIPFSLGQKSCIGERLAYVEAVIVLEMLCKKYKINPIAYNIEHKQLITLHPKEKQLITLVKR
jgi:cytochrome P450